MWYITKIGSAWKWQGWKGSHIGRRELEEKVNAKTSAVIAVEMTALHAAVNPGSAQVHQKVFLGKNKFHNFGFLPSFLNVLGHDGRKRKEKKEPWESWTPHLRIRLFSNGNSHWCHQSHS